MTELGNRLKEAREAKGLSLDDLQTITKIQKRYLIGIEEGNYTMMPGKFYVRAFIKQYAEAVNLNPEELFDLYKEEVPSVVNTELPELSRVKTRKSISDGNSKVFDILPKLLIGVFILGAAALIYYFLQQNAGENTKEEVNTGNEPVNFEQSENLESKQDDKQETSADTNTEEDGQSDDNTASEEETETEEAETPVQEVNIVSTKGSETVYELKNTDHFELKLVSTGETWVNMKNGKGFSLYQGMLKKGQTESQTVDYSKETEAVLVIGNSVNTEIYINDQKLEYAIAPTDEVRQDIVIRFSQKVE
ncbi:RodZ domain-containing protein [Neobacillus sp. D3-1R]|uniref:helix-turn-helix domain-containing protein n=1 Tax=Neobacillus sp. D3-1R TaxID=3445778 RepID=UPI003FA0AADC